MPPEGRLSPARAARPFTVEQGSSATVEFRNVFGDTREFSFAVDHPDFSVGAAKASVNARSPTTCAVSFNPQPPPEDSTAPPQPSCPAGYWSTSSTTARRSRGSST